MHRALFSKLGQYLVSRDGTVVIAPPTNVTQIRFLPSDIYGLSSLLVLSLLQGFFSEFCGFPLSMKTKISKFKFEDDKGPA